MLSKLIVVGFMILEIANLITYKFYYNCLLLTFGERLRMCYADTDTVNFICHVESKHILNELKAISSKYLDTSNFDRDHPL